MLIGHQPKEFLLAVEGLTVSFDGFKAVNDLSFYVEENEIRVIIGPNGAGKTTVLDLICGKTKATSGSIQFRGQELTRMKENQIVQTGVGRKFQTPTVFDSLTVFENLELALPGKRGVWSTLLAKVSGEEKDKIEKQLTRVRLIDQIHRPAKLLSHGQRQWLEISMLMLSSPKLLLVDEPAAGLTDHETALTAELLLELKGDHTLIVIEHDMEFVRRLGTRVTCLCEGKVLADGTLDEVSADEKVRSAYLGRAKKGDG